MMEEIYIGNSPFNGCETKGTDGFDQTRLYTNLMTKEELTAAGIWKFSDEAIKEEREYIERWKKKHAKEREATRLRAIMGGMPRGKLVLRKVCRMCGRELDISMFALNSKRADGHQPVCKKCINDCYRQMRLEMMNKTNKEQ